MSKTELELLGEISEKLDRLIGLFAIQNKDSEQQIGILKEMGFEWEFIGSVTGLKPSAARMRYTRSNKG